MKSPLIIRSAHFPPKPFGGISLFGVFIFRKDCHVTATDFFHETIHYHQQREWLFLPFFVLYAAEYLIHLVRYRNCMKAYRAISFEREAYAHQNHPNYLKKRPRWANYRKLEKNE